MTLKSTLRHPQDWVPIVDLVESAVALPEELKTNELHSLINELKVR